jgi:hypothetical protein
MGNNNSPDDPNMQEAFRKNQAIDTYNQQCKALMEEQGQAALEGRPQPSAEEQARVFAPLQPVADRR